MYSKGKKRKWEKKGTARLVLYVLGPDRIPYYSYHTITVEHKKCFGKLGWVRGGGGDEDFKIKKIPDLF